MKPYFRYLGLAVVCSGLVGGAFVDEAYADEPYCREYTQTFTIAGQEQRGYGTACLQPDGSWKIVSQNEVSEQDNAQKSQVYYVVEDKVIYIMPREVRYFSRPLFFLEPQPFHHHHPGPGRPHF